jgi:Na+-driven multidrug efflux pump
MSGSVQGMACIVVCTYVMQCDGIFIGSMDFSHLPRTNLVACAACGLMLWYGQQHGYGLNWIWWAMVIFFLVRLIQHIIHAAVHFETSAFGRYNRSTNQERSDAPLLDNQV